MPSLVPAQGSCLVSVVEYRNVSMSLHYSRVSWSPLPPCLVGHLLQKKKTDQKTVPAQVGPGRGREVGHGWCAKLSCSDL